MTLTDGQQITLDCSQGETGRVYSGIIAYETTQLELSCIPHLPSEIMVNIADPNTVFVVSQLPVAGVGLARMEFIIANSIKVHPMALLAPEKVTDPAVEKEIAQITAAYSDQPSFFTNTLAQGIGMIAAAFYPKPVVVRLSDFKSNEYRNLLGGSYFEPQEENPMLGLRGASRYINPLYQQAFDHYGAICPHCC